MKNKYYLRTEDFINNKNSTLVVELSKELKEFLIRRPARSFSTYAEIKIFTSAYLHMTNSLAVYIGPDSFSDNEPEEVIDLWGLSFCQISNYEKIFRKDTSFLEGLSAKQKQSISSELNETTNIIDVAVFFLLEKSGQNEMVSQIEDDLTQKLAKTHHKLTWKEYTLWWNLNHSPKEGYLPYDPKETNPYMDRIPKKVPKNFEKMVFFDPFEMKFLPKNIISDVEGSRFIYNESLFNVTTFYLKKSLKPSHGRILINKIPGINSFQKRKLIKLTQTALICGTTGIPLLSTDKGVTPLCNPKANTYELMQGTKLCSKFEEIPNRNTVELKGAWMSVHLQNNVVSHFFFEVLKKVLYAARVMKFGLLITGVKPAAHILEFFTVDSELKDRITEIKICDPDLIYKPQSAILAFEYHREFRPEDLLNFQWFGESIIARSKEEKSFGKKIYISRRDSPASRIIINENYLISKLKKSGFQILRFDQLSLVQKLTAIKNADEIVTAAGSGYLFRNLVATNNKVKVITSDTYVWNDYSICATGTGVRNEIFIIFEKEMSLASNYYASCRNHASIKITQDFFKKHEDIKWGEKNVLWAFDSISSSMTSASN